MFSVKTFATETTMKQINEDKQKRNRYTFSGSWMKIGWVSECSWSILAGFAARKNTIHKKFMGHIVTGALLFVVRMLVVGEHESHHTWFRNARQPSDNSHSTASGTVSVIFRRVLCYIWMTSVYSRRFRNYLCLRVPFIVVFVETRKMIRKCFVIHKITNGLRGFRLNFGPKRFLELIDSKTSGKECKHC